MVNSKVSFESAPSVLVLEFEKKHEHPLSESRRKAFRLVGISVPADADRTQRWEPSYESLIEDAGHHFTCYFENGEPDRWVARHVASDCDLKSGSNGGFGHSAEVKGGLILPLLWSKFDAAYTLKLTRVSTAAITSLSMPERGET